MKNKSLFKYIILFLASFTIGILFEEYVDIDLKDGPSILYYLLFAFLIFQLTILIHELGHLIFGYLTGYTFLSFRYLSFIILKDKEGKFHFSRYAISGTLGQCLMIPPDQDEIPIFWYNFGGIFLNILMVLIGFILIMWDKHDLLVINGYLLSAINALFVYLNWFPIKGITNDGNNYREAKKSKTSRVAFKDILNLTAQSVYGIRPSQVPLLSNVEELQYEKPFQAAIKMQMNMNKIIQGDVDGFISSIKEVEQKIIQKELKTNVIVKLYSYLAKLLLNYPISNNKQLKLLYKRLKYEPFIYVIRYVEALKKSKTEAELIKIQFNRFSRKSHLKGDVLDCIDLIETLSEYVLKRSLEQESPITSGI